jgi:hypothetical protein
MNKTTLLSKAFALVLISLLMALVMKIHDANSLAQLGNQDSASSDYAAEHLRHIHQHSYFLFLLGCLSSGLFMLAL